MAYLPGKKQKPPPFSFGGWDLLQGLSAQFFSVFCVSPFPQQSPVMYLDDFL